MSMIARSSAEHSHPHRNFSTADSIGSTAWAEHNCRDRELLDYWGSLFWKVLRKILHRELKFAALDSAPQDEPRKSLILSSIWQVWCSLVSSHKAWTPPGLPVIPTWPDLKSPANLHPRAQPSLYHCFSSRASILPRATHTWLSWALSFVRWHQWTGQEMQETPRGWKLNSQFQGCMLYGWIRFSKSVMIGYQSSVV